MNDIIRTLHFEKEQLEARIRLLEDKLESDNRQISEYDHELRQTKRQAKRLLKMAMEDLAAAEDCTLCKYEADDIPTCQSKPVNCFVWRHADEALVLIGGYNG